MVRRFLHSKIHRARVTQTDLDYEGSLTLDPDLREAAGMLPAEQIDVYNLTRGTRLTTYIIEGKRGSGEICVNGAAAHLCEVGDLIIAVTYCELTEEEYKSFTPKVIKVDDKNRPVA